MISGFFSVLTTALIITGVGVALRPNAPTAAVIRSFTDGFANIETAAAGR